MRCTHSEGQQEMEQSPTFPAGLRPNPPTPAVTPSAKTGPRLFAPGAVIPGIRNINGHRASAQQQTVFRHNAPSPQMRVGVRPTGEPE